MPDASDWSFSRSAPAPPAPPTRPNGTAPSAPPGAAPVAPGPMPPTAGDGDDPKAAKSPPTKAEVRKRTVLRVAIVAGGVLVVAGLLVAIYLVVASGSGDSADLSGYSAVPADYVPEQVDGRDVRTTAPVLGEVAERFTSARGLEGADFDVATGMVPEGPREPPQSVVLVLGGSGAGGLTDSFADDADVQEDTTVDADGIDVRLVRVDDDTFSEVWTAIASPRDDIAVVAMSFSGGRRAAEDMARAALERGKQ